MPARWRLWMLTARLLAQAAATRRGGGGGRKQGCGRQDGACWLALHQLVPAAATNTLAAKHTGPPASQSNSPSPHQRRTNGIELVDGHSFRVEPVDDALHAGGLNVEEGECRGTAGAERQRRGWRGEWGWE